MTRLVNSGLNDDMHWVRQDNLNGVEDSSCNGRKDDDFRNDNNSPHKSPEVLFNRITNRGKDNKSFTVQHAVPFEYKKRQDDDDDDEDDSDDEDDGDYDRLWKWCRTLPWRITQTSPRTTIHAYLEQKLPDYSVTSLHHDVIAGMTVAIMAVPLGMSYARLAGLPAHYGIYASFVPPMVYPLFSSSRHLAVGPAALVSLVLHTGLTGIVQDDEHLIPGTAEYTARYTSLAMQCTFLSAMVHLAAGVLRLGFVTQILSRALVSGFTSGAALIIACSQLEHILGYNIDNSNRIHKLVEYLARDVTKFNWKTCTMGVGSMVTVLAFNHVSETYPKYGWVRALGPFVVSAVAIAITVAWDLDNNGIPIVGHIPAGLPSVVIDQWTPISGKVWFTVISIVIVGFVQSIAISKRFAYKHSYEIDPSQEIVALGMANLIGGIFQSFPVTGALGQSAVNDNVGAKTGVSSILTGLVVMVVLLFMTPVFEKMPLNVLAAIVISFVIKMFDYKEAKYLCRVLKFEFVVWMVAFLGTMFLGVESGLGIAVAVSLLLVMYESVLYPHTAVLGRLPGTTLFRNVKQYPAAERYDGIVICRVDAPLFFANAQTVRDKIRKYKRVAAIELAERHGTTTNPTNAIRYIILDLSAVSHVDTTALHVLEDMYVTQKKMGVQICFCNPGIKVLKRFVRSGIVDLVGREHFFSADIDAVNYCLSEIMDHDAEQPPLSSLNIIRTQEHVPP